MKENSTIRQRSVSLRLNETQIKSTRGEMLREEGGETSVDIYLYIHGGKGEKLRHRTQKKLHRER